MAGAYRFSVRRRGSADTFSVPRGDRALCPLSWCGQFKSEWGLSGMGSVLVGVGLGAVVRCLRWHLEFMVHASTASTWLCLGRRPQ